MVLVASNKYVMGKYANSSWYNVIAWIFTVVLIILTLLLLASTLVPNIFDMLVQK